MDIGLGVDSKDLIELGRRLLRAVLGLDEAKRRKDRALTRATLTRAEEILDQVAETLLSATTNVRLAESLLNEFWRLIGPGGPPSGPGGGRGEQASSSSYGQDRMQNLVIRADNLKAMLLKVTDYETRHGKREFIRRALAAEILEVLGPRGLASVLPQLDDESARQLKELLTDDPPPAMTFTTA